MQSSSYLEPDQWFQNKLNLSSIRLMISNLIFQHNDKYWLNWSLLCNWIFVHVNLSFMKGIPFMLTTPSGCFLSQRKKERKMKMGVRLHLQISTHIFISFPPFSRQSKGVLINFSLDSHTKYSVRHQPIGRTIYQVKWRLLERLDMDSTSDDSQTYFHPHVFIE